MTRVAAQAMSAALVVAVAAGMWWLINPSTHFVPTKTAISSYETQSAAVGSQQGAPHNPHDLVVRSSTLASGDKGLRAVVVQESSSSVVVAMSYEKFECNGCARTAQGFIVPVTVHLHDPLGLRTVIDDLTHRAVKYQKLP